jgi:hypothetical protein
MIPYTGSVSSKIIFNNGMMVRMEKTLKKALMKLKDTFSHKYFL